MWVEGNTEQNCKVARGARVLIAPRVLHARRGNRREEHRELGIVKLRDWLVEVEHTGRLQALHLIAHIDRVGVHREHGLLRVEEFERYRTRRFYQFMHNRPVLLIAEHIFDQLLRNRARPSGGVAERVAKSCTNTANWIDPKVPVKKSVFFLDEQLSYAWRKRSGISAILLLRIGCQRERGPCTVENCGRLEACIALHQVVIEFEQCAKYRE